MHNFIKKFYLSSQSHESVEVGRVSCSVEGHMINITVADREPEIADAHFHLYVSPKSFKGGYSDLDQFIEALTLVREEIAVFEKTKRIKKKKIVSKSSAKKKTTKKKVKK